MSETLERYRWLIAAVLAVPLLVGIGVLLNNRLADPDPLVINAGDAPTDIRAYVTGAVINPGVYPLQEGDRWIDALEAAGGPAPDADLTAVNLARRVQDEDEIIVPRAGATAVADAAQGPLIDINSAGQAELESLPGIGEVRAGAIIQSRTQDGAFGAVEDLLARKLVPQSVYEDIVPLIAVNR
ncbi:MAG: ComEA family DNA-binding protein [Sulfuricaulis sp.]|nr:ComEA family DNA-binding protein [Sulfuricaulis sp.]